MVVPSQSDVDLDFSLRAPTSLGDPPPGSVHHSAFYGGIVSRVSFAVSASGIPSVKPTLR